MPAMHANKRKNEFTVLDALELLQAAELTPAETKALAVISENAADKEFSRRVAILKRSRDGASLPKQILANTIIGPAEFRTPCPCQWLKAQAD